jgi:hypothetical protein
MINDDIAARIAAKADRDETINACWQCGRRGPWRIVMDCDHLAATCSGCRATYDIGHSAVGFDPDATERPRDETPTLPWLQPATVDPDWLTEARNHSAATREPFTHPLWDVSAA